MNTFPKLGFIEYNGGLTDLQSISMRAGNDRNVRYTTFARQTGATPLCDVASASELSAAYGDGAGA